MKKNYLTAGYARTNTNVFVILILTVIIGLFLPAGWPASNQAEAAISQPGTWMEAINGTSSSGTYSYTAAAGTSRILAVAIITAHGSNSTITPTITFGGTALTEGRSDRTVSMRQHTLFYYLPEASIPSGAQTLSVNVGGTVQRMGVWVGTFEGVDQNTPVDSSQNSNRNTDGTTAQFSSNFTINADCQGVLLTALYNHTDTQGANFGTDPPTGFSTAASYSDNTSNSKAFRLNNYTTIPSSTVNTTASHGNCDPGTLGFSMTGVSLMAVAAPTGDLAIGNGTNPSSADAQPGSTDNAIDSFTMAMSLGTGQVNSLTLTTSAQFTAANVTNIRVYEDAGTLGTYNSGVDILIPTSFSIGSSTATITFPTPETVSTSTINYLITVDIASGATLGNTLTARATGASGTGLGTPVYNDSGSATLTIATVPTGDLTIGDGTNPSNADAQQGSANNAIDSFSTDMSSLTGQIASLTLTTSAQFTVGNVTNIRVYLDNGQKGSYGAQDTLVPSSYSIGASTATITFSTPETATTTAEDYLITVDIASGATAGNTLTARVTGASGTGLGTPVYSDSASATLTILGAPCSRVNPTVTLSPPSRNIPAGGSGDYQILVTNNDSATCTATTFNLSATDNPSTPNSDFNASTVPASIGPINPGSYMTATLTTSATAGALSGANEATTVTTAADGNHGAVTSLSVATTAALVEAPAGDVFLYVLLSAGMVLLVNRRGRSGNTSARP